MQSLNESLIKEVKNLKKENTSKGKWEKDDSRENMKKNNIKRYVDYKIITKNYSMRLRY